MPRAYVAPVHGNPIQGNGVKLPEFVKLGKYFDAKSLVQLKLSPGWKDWRRHLEFVRYLMEKSSPLLNI